MEQHEQMANPMRPIKGRAVLSINDHADIRRVFDGLPLVPLQLKYSMSWQHTGRKSGELIINSWQDEQLPTWA